MSAYYVIAIVIAVGAIVLSAIGLTREDFPPTARAGRAVMAGTLLLVVAGVIALLATTHVEHPREEAAEAAAEEKAVEERASRPRVARRPGRPSTSPRTSSRSRWRAASSSRPVRYTFAVANEGAIQHDLAIEGDQLDEEPKTKLIDAEERAPLEVDLPPGKYKFYCTVPGHEQSGMKADVTVR